MGIYVKFTKTTHQIWSCHVTLASNSEVFIFCPILYLILGKVTKFRGNWLKNKNVTGKKQTRGWKRPPIVLKGLITLGTKTQVMVPAWLKKFQNGSASFWDLFSSYLAQSSYLVRNNDVKKYTCTYERKGCPNTLHLKSAWSQHAQSKSYSLWYLFRTIC